MEPSTLNAQSQGGEQRRRTYAVLIVHVVNLVDSQPLPLVQLLLLECKGQICDENLERSNEDAGRGRRARTRSRHLDELTAHHAWLSAATL